MPPALFGLILAGGASTRMRRDKAVLAYHGQSQLEWAYHLLSEVCAATFVSVRPDQRDEPTRARFPQIVDRQPGIGPIAGIAAAMQEHPKVAWLVLACDLPFLTRETLQHLIAQRDPRSVATAYRSTHDGLPEPLCAIWEPAAREEVLAHIESGKQCPRKFLIDADTRLLDLPDPRALDNINTATEFSAASVALQSTPTTRVTPQASPAMAASAGAAPASDPATPPVERSGRPISIRVQYFALLREQAGRGEETVTTNATTPEDLYDELRARHGFKLDKQQLKVAINADFRDWRTMLANGDSVVFIPPVAGG